MSEDFTDNSDLKRFELRAQDHLVKADYHIDGQTLYIDYVEAPPALRGTGAAGRLMEAIMAHAAQNEQAVVPVCGYAAAWMRRHRAL
ncbi:MAG: GNAT family N-acetyltransferase [Asticcacaulis sp.]